MYIYIFLILTETHEIPFFETVKRKTKLYIRKIKIYTLIVQTFFYKKVFWKSSNKI